MGNKNGYIGFKRGCEQLEKFANKLDDKIYVENLKRCIRGAIIDTFKVETYAKIICMELFYKQNKEWTRNHDVYLRQLVKETRDFDFILDELLKI